MRKSNYLALALTIIGLCFLNPLFSQENTYEIVKDNNVSNISDYEFAMDKANFDSYRYIQKRRKITFNTGVEIELLSVEELQALNISVDAAKASTYNATTETNPIYRLGNNGYILSEIQSKPKKQ